MKAKPETALLTVLTGSWLYGTATEKSDYDYKSLVLPSIDDLLLNKKITNRKQKPEGSGPQDVMLAGESETEYVPLQVFLSDFMSGQTYSLEMCYAIADRKFTLAEDFGIYNDQVISYYANLATYMLDNFLTRNVKAMTGYAVSQSKLYGLKTERYTVIDRLAETIESRIDGSIRASTRLQDTPEFLKELCKINHVKMSTLMNGKGGTEEIPALEICGKKHTVTTYWSTVLRSLENTLEMYGDRVKQFRGEGADWKALSHAIRITEQAIELCNTGKITFPRPNADFLLKVKLGKVSLEEAANYLQEEFDKIDSEVNNSKLPEKTSELEERFTAWKLKILHELYELEE